MHHSRAVEARPDKPPFVVGELETLQQYRRILPPSTIEVPSLWHGACTHRWYNLTCEDFEAILRDAAYKCQRCRKSSERLHIDHDHQIGRWGVRGVVCPACNSHLALVDAGRTPVDELSARYLANPPACRRPFDWQAKHDYAYLLRMRSWRRADAERWHRERERTALEMRRRAERNRAAGLPIWKAGCPSVCPSCKRIWNLGKNGIVRHEISVPPSPPDFRRSTRVCPGSGLQPRDEDLP